MKSFNDLLSLAGFRKHEEIQDEILGLEFPKCRSSFPIYPKDEWLGVWSNDKTKLIGNFYWAQKGKFGLHWHEGIAEIADVIEGSFILFVPGQKPRHYRQGETYELAPGVKHAIEWLEPTTLFLKWKPAFKNNAWVYEGDLHKN